MLLSLNGDIPEQEEQNIQQTAALPEVVELARLGDAGAFAALFHQYNAPICAYLARMVGNDEVGRDLAQETFLRAWRSLPALTGESFKFKPWLYRIATNLARDHQRRARLIRWLPWEQYQQREQTDQPGSAGPETQVEEAELLKQALAQVSLTYRACLVLYIVEDLPQPAIAERLGIKASYVSNYVSRGLAELRRIYLRLAAENPHPQTGGSSHE